MTIKTAARINGTEIHRVVEACKTRLAIDFDTPAKMIFGQYGPQIGLTGDEMDRLIWELAGE